ncbi:MAG: hypothetical protein ACJ71Y_14525, partial [Blastococcus sp.]
MGSGHGMGNEELARAVLDRYGTTYAGEAGIPPADEPEPLFQLLVLALLLSARIGAGVAVATARELFAAGWTTPARLRGAWGCPMTRNGSRTWSGPPTSPGSRRASCVSPACRPVSVPSMTDRGCGELTVHPDPGGPMTQQTWPADEPHEVVLGAGDARLAVDLRGGGMRRL